MDELGDRTDAFRFDYRPAAIRYGDGAAAKIGDELAAQGVSRALLVAGETTGTTPAVVDPVAEGAGERLGGVFAETTPAKRLDAALRAVERYDDVGADGLLALGGGSTLDVAKATRALVATADREAAVSAFEETGALPVPADLPPLVVVPTTLAGADLSVGGGLTATPANGRVESTVRGGLSAPQAMPSAAVYDPALVATTPTDVLCASAMNGFDKGVESLYARTATPVTDATAARGLRLLRGALPTLRGEAPDYGRALRGTVLVQYGVSRPDASTLALIHAFGHGLTAHSTVQQGAAHGVVAPHALAHVLDGAPERAGLLADALRAPGERGGTGARAAGRDGADEDAAERAVDAVATVRDALGLPSRLRDVGDVAAADLEAMAATTAADGLLENVPAGVDVSAAALERVLERAY